MHFIRASPPNNSSRPAQGDFLDRILQTFLRTRPRVGSKSIQSRLASHANTAAPRRLCGLPSKGPPARRRDRRADVPRPSDFWDRSIRTWLSYCVSSLGEPESQPRRALIPITASRRAKYSQQRECQPQGVPDRLCLGRTRRSGDLFVLGGQEEQAEPMTLRTDRLLLRPFEFTDVGDVYAYARDSEWGRYLPVPKPYEYRHAVEFVKSAVRTSWITNPVFAICLDGRIVGGINVSVDACDATAEMGYSIAREHWGEGLATEAARAVMDWAFETFDLAKVTAEADIANIRSWRVMERLGMKREGVPRGERQGAGDPQIRQEMVIYSVLREEWQSRAAEP